MRTRSAVKPAFGFRAVMLDMARVTENKEYYASLLPWLAEWGYNTVHLHLTDDQGCALRLPSRPELATPGAYTAGEMKGFIAEARRHGLEVMPEIECLGHTRFITARRRYRGLAEPCAEKGGFNAICPSHAETREVLRDLLRDAAAIFDHPVIHVGLDEVRFGRCPRCARAFGRGAPNWRRYAAHAAWVHEEVRRVGRRPAMWADHALKPADIARGFRRDVLMFHWQYQPEFDSPRAAELMDLGFDVVACPATVCWLTRVAPNAGNLANLRSCTARSLKQRRRGLRGISNTVWCPWRYLPGAIDFGVAMGGHLASEPEESAGFPALFAARFYGIAGGAAAAEAGSALVGLAEAALPRPLCDRVMQGGANGLPFTREDRRLCGLAAVRAAASLAALKAARPSVRRNRERYDDVVLTARAVLAVARFGAAGRRKSAVPGARAVYRRVLAAWNRDRREDDSAKFGDPLRHGEDALLYILDRLR